MWTSQKDEVPLGNIYEPVLYSQYEARCIVAIFKGTDAIKSEVWIPRVLVLYV